MKKAKLHVLPVKDLMSHNAIASLQRLCETPSDARVKSTMPQGRLHTKHSSSHSPGNQGSLSWRHQSHGGAEVGGVSGDRLDEPLLEQGQPEQMWLWISTRMEDPQPLWKIWSCAWSPSLMFKNNLPYFTLCLLPLGHSLGTAEKDLCLNNPSTLSL